MTAAASVSGPAQSVGQIAEEQVRRTVKALRSAQDVSIKTMCERTGVSRGTYFSRMNGSTPFTAGEVAELADLFGVAVGDLYAGRVNVGPRPPTDGSSAPTNPALDTVTGWNSACAPAAVIPLRRLADAA